jgi:hypothetical protein
MKELLLPHDPVKAMSEAYESLLDKALHKGHQSGCSFK